MKQTIIAISGGENSGKSTTIKMFYDELKAKYKNAKPLEEKIDKKDMKAILIINGVKIGIESQGDPSHRLKDSLDEFKNKQCTIIICATRKRGGTYCAADNLQPEYNLIRIWKDREITASKQNLNNKETATYILSLLSCIDKKLSI